MKISTQLMKNKFSITRSLKFTYMHQLRLIKISNQTYSFKNHTNEPYKLEENFINLYKNKTPNFGYNGLGEFVYKRTYARLKSDNTLEEWFETVRRVVEGTINLLFFHYDNQKIHISDMEYEEIKKDSFIMYDKIFNFKFLPPGRGLWSMGTTITDYKKIFTSLNNCAFVSTKLNNEYDVEDIIKPYLFLMDNAMLGVGIGFDTKASNSNIIIKTVLKDQRVNFVVEDSREGWVESVGALLKAYILGTEKINFDYSKVRPAGSPLKVFGGVSAGPAPLMDLHKSLEEILDKNIGKAMDSRLIVDIMNLIGRAVVAGNIRRTAEIAIGEANDYTFMNLKNYSKFPERMPFGWLSNNSIYAELGMNYSQVVENILENGEPGFLWLENMQKYSRMCEAPDFKDMKASGGNPCLEQTLESFEMCCLSESFPSHHENLDEFLETLKYAFLYAKIVTLGLTHWPETNEVMSRNRRIGLSMTGIAQFLTKFNINVLKTWCESGYYFVKNFDKFISKKFNVPESIKITSIKPSGTVSLVGGATPGVHFPLSRFYIRRVRVSNKSELLKDLINAGYHVEPDQMQPQSTMVVSFPINLGEGIKTIKDTNIWEQLSLAAFMQNYWADNQVSCTVSFSKENERKQIVPALDYFQYKLKGISFLPQLDNKTPYPQMPYEEIDENTYGMMFNEIRNKQEKNGNRKDLVKDGIKKRNIFKHDDGEGSNFCDSDRCDV